jgi:hypothetical protein
MWVCLVGFLLFLCLLYFRPPSIDTPFFSEKSVLTVCSVVVPLEVLFAGLGVPRQMCVIYAYTHAYHPSRTADFA